MRTMLDERDIAKLTEDEINAVAVKYDSARKAGRRNEANHYVTDLYRIVTGRSILHKKIAGYFSSWTVTANEKDTDISHDYFVYSLKYYDSDKNDNYCAFMMKYLRFFMLDKYKGKKLELLRTESLDKEAGDDISDGEKNMETEREIAQPSFEDEVDMNAALSRLPSLVLGFYRHFSGLQANPVRYSYFKIFNTESVISLIEDHVQPEVFNKAETMASIDMGYVQFISTSEVESPQDLRRLKYRTYGEVLEKTTKPEEFLKVPCEGKVIAEYRYKSGLDPKRVSDSAVTQQKICYKKAVMELLG